MTISYCDEDAQSQEFWGMANSVANALSDTVVGLPVQPLKPPLTERAALQTRWLADASGLPWFAAAVDGTDWLSVSTTELPPVRLHSIPPPSHGISFQPLHQNLVWYALDPRITNVTELLLCGYACVDERPEFDDWCQILRTAGWSTEQLRTAWKKVPLCSADVLQRLLQTVARQRAAVEREHTNQKRIQRLTSISDMQDQELKLFRSLIEQFGYRTPISKLAGVAFQNLQALLPADGYIFWQSESTENKRVHVHGDPRFGSPRQIAALISHLNLISQDRPIATKLPSWTEVEYPGLLDHCIAVPLQRSQGWFVVCNQHAPVLLPIHAEALQGIADLLTIPLQQAQLHSANEELALGVVRSLVSTLDAKDPYTRGHSERVARIAKRLGQQLGLSHSELDDIFLAGLLHDIGKIGVNDRILQKIEPLTAEEFREIQQHPLIGFDLLAPIRRLKAILPGVRHHHEAYNGRGYPDRLTGEEIPLMARIIAVADSFDAMISDRPYRPGMPRDRVEAIFRRGIDEQWDGRVLEAYFQARNDILALLAPAFADVADIPLPVWQDAHPTRAHAEVELLAY